MKFKPLYIYLLGVVIAVVAFFIVSKDSGSSIAPQNGIANQQMPQDDIHKGLSNPNGPPPNKDNVNQEVMKHLAMLKQAVEQNPNDTLKMRQYADFLAAAHQQDEAIEYYNKILKINPRRIDILSAVAYINYLNQKFDVAENYLNKILAVDKNNLEAQYNLGAVAFSSGDKAKAKQIWTKLAKEHPQTQMGETAKKTLSQM